MTALYTHCDTDGRDGVDSTIYADCIVYANRLAIRHGGVGP